ncbi:coiled-coil domain-containing protein [Brevibacillus sp. SYSU BS000544]|uniref:coiled-coil domain-containing protein n=1 Tax=Brevibacillus sp. SYSU BS000544 TaxID=3416443 RepID=UPI003CE49F30
MLKFLIIFCEKRLDVFHKSGYDRLRANKTVMIVLFVLIFSTPPSVLQAEEILPIEQLILQQHFTQMELERNLTLVKAEEATLFREIEKLDQQLISKEQHMRQMRKHAGDVARAYYMGERDSLLSLLFETKNFNDLLLLLDFLEYLFERDMSKLETFQAERQQAIELQASKQVRLNKVQQLRTHFEQQLAEIKRIQAEKEKNLQTLKDPTSVQTLMDHIITDWRNRGLPAFRTYFAALSTVMLELQELATPEHIQSNGLFSHRLTIGEAEFNQFLASKNELFKESKFQFTNNQLIVDGSYQQMNLKIVGNYELVSPTELKFHMKQLLFDGFLLPDTTIKELEKEYNLGFYPTLISPNIKVEGMTLADQKLELDIKFELGFGF